MDVFLYYLPYATNKTRPAFKNKYHTYPDVNGMWVIGYSLVGSADLETYKDFVLAYNPYCVDTKYPANGGCEYGWFKRELGYKLDF